MGSFVRKSMSQMGRFTSFQGLALCVLLWGSSVVPSSAQSGNVFANPEQVAKILRDDGYAAKLDSDVDGDPLIRSSSQGLKWNIYFYGCTKGRNCNAVQFSCGLEAKGEIPLEQLNEWNRNWRYTKTYLLKNGSVTLSRDLDLAGGIPRTNFKSVMESWDLQLGKFKGEMGW
jgi:hypothetical protein